MSIIYNIAFIIFAVVYIPIFLLKKRRREGIALRFGLYSKELIEKLKSKENIWVHAVSVGEVMAAGPLLSRLRQRYPGYRLVITTVTETGNAVAKKIAGDSDIVLFLPFDIRPAVRRAISYIRPTMLLIAETEIWPNLITEAARSNVAIFLVNGRISDGSFGRYKLVKFMLKPVLEGIKLFLMQSEIDEERIISLGAEPSRVSISGNIKFDAATSEDLLRQDNMSLKSSLGLREDDKLFVAGSTHPGEEEIIMSAYIELKKEFANLRLLIAPRHIERTTALESFVKRYDFTSVRVSQLGKNKNQELAAKNYELFLLDTVGQLKSFYAIADIVFMGGSLVKKGGQNMIEPACFAKPILFGPYTFNFRDITDLFLKEEAAIVVKDKTALVKAASDILKGDDTHIKNLGQRAKELVDTNKGAVEKTLEAINEKLSL
ncbi:MAG: 3-deoxy-D-manno-octulosonic acid transferase [Candidatus Omnitrophica bacterium]|nr:3-deoxy-D-manno-octulosonic acid transferase [Candidatus Omnitrophota bacterium]